MTGQPGALTITRNSPARRELAAEFVADLHCIDAQIRETRRAANSQCLAYFVIEGQPVRWINAP